MGWSLVYGYRVGRWAMTEVGWREVAAIIIVCTAAGALSACGDDSAFDIATQIGPSPNLPEPRQYLLPPMHIASVVGWKQGESPTVAAGLKVEAIATGLEHPRSLYVLPNRDVLVVESKAPPAAPISRPKDLVMK
jgi:glucose/arabinose dehydrogenase